MSEKDDFVCTIEPKPVAEWLEDDKANEEGCPSCLLAPLASYYLGALEEAGETKLAEELKKTFEAGDPLTIARKLDTIKEGAGEALSKQLKNLDCFAQTFKPEDAATEAA